MKVNLPHSLDFHSAEVNPGKRYADLAPGKSMHYRFKAEHPGVFMYHCATQPVLMHTGAGMVGMFVVKPRNLAPVDKELWITQQEYYIGKPGQDADMAKMAAKKPDVIAFNGYANQYKDNPISVKPGEKGRMYVLNAGPSIWSAFHVIGTVFDRTVIEGRPGADSQTMNLAPSQGGWAEFTLDEEGGYPFVTHAFADAGKGAIGVLQHAGGVDGDVALGVAEDREDIGRWRGDGALDFDACGHRRIVSVQRSARGAVWDLGCRVYMLANAEPRRIVCRATPDVAPGNRVHPRERPPGYRVERHRSRDQRDPALRPVHVPSPSGHDAAGVPAPRAP